MNRTLSVYFDFVRFFAALMVFFFHANEAKFHATFLAPVGLYGRDAVIAFFVLSGFVIAYIAGTKESTPGTYLVSRFARLYSVVFPAMILTVVASYIGLQFDATVYADGDYRSSDPLLRFITPLLFSNELWFWSWQPFSNSPFWSISYEFWYYMIFAAAFFLRGPARIVGTALVVLIAGPKIVLLLPIWLLGYFVYRYHDRLPTGFKTGCALLVLPIVAYCAFRYWNGQTALNRITVAVIPFEILALLEYSIRFLTDYVIGLLVAIHFAGAIVLSRYFSFPSLVAAVIRYLAGMTFSLYLFHFPLLMMFAAIFDNGVFVLAGVVAVILVLAPLTEGRKDDWKRLFEALRVRLKVV